MQMAYQSQKAGFHGDKGLRRANTFRFGTGGKRVPQNGTPMVQIGEPRQSLQQFRGGSEIA